MRRGTYPLLAAAVAAVALLTVQPLGLSRALDGPLLVLVWAPMLIGYALGTAAEPWPGVAGVLVLTAGLQATSPTFNPLFEMITFGPWLAGRVVRSRQELTARLAARNAELRREEEAYRQESIRYERARTARELHDIVAHSMSLIVVQAAARQRLPDDDRRGLTATLDCVAEAAEQAADEVKILVALLSGAPHDGGIRGLEDIDELVDRTRRSGITVTYTRPIRMPLLTPQASEAAYRVVQEALTNAVKHAPGAPVDVTMREVAGGLETTVVNGMPNAPAIGLGPSGAGRGLTGMRERVSASGGHLGAGPTATGDWLVSVVLPTPSAAVPTID